MKTAMKTLLILLLLAAGSAAELSGTEKKIPVPRMKLVRCAEAPRIDGKLDDPVWKNAARTPPFVLFNTPKKPLFHTHAMAAFDDVNLYVAFDARDRDIQKWFTPSGRKFDGKVWMDDCLEVYIADPADPEKLYQFVVNYDGVGFDRSTRNGDEKWNGVWRYAVHVGKTGYSAEFAIPFYTLGITPGKTAFAMNLCREKYVLPSELSSWSCAYGDFHFTERFGKVEGLSLTPWKVFLDDVRFPERLKRGENTIRCTVANNTRAPWEGSVIAEDFRNGKHLVLAEQKIVLQSGEKKEIPLRPRLLSGAKHLLTLAVKTAGGKTVRQIFRNLDVPNALKVAAHPFIQYQGEAPGAALEVAFPEDARALECRITGKNGNAGRISPVRSRSMSITLPSERLKPGDYRVEYTLHDRSGTLTETRPLKITTSPWKENEK